MAGTRQDQWKRRTTGSKSLCLSILPKARLACIFQSLTYYEIYLYQLLIMALNHIVHSLIVSPKLVCLSAKSNISVSAQAFIWFGNASCSRMFWLLLHKIIHLYPRHSCLFLCTVLSLIYEGARVHFTSHSMFSPTSFTSLLIWRDCVRFNQWGVNKNSDY